MKRKLLLNDIFPYLLTYFTLILSSIRLCVFFTASYPFFFVTLHLSFSPGSLRIWLDSIGISYSGTPGNLPQFKGRVLELGPFMCLPVPVH